MTIATEQALAGLHAALEATFRAADMPTPVRNRAMPEEAPLWPNGASGAPRLFVGYVDGRTQQDGRLVAAAGEKAYELTQFAVVEIMVEDSVDERRLESFSACLEQVAAAVEGIDPADLGGGVSTVEITTIERDGLVTDGTPGTSAAAVEIAITLVSPRPF